MFVLLPILQEEDAPARTGRQTNDDDVVADTNLVHRMSIETPSHGQLNNNDDDALTDLVNRMPIDG